MLPIQGREKPRSGNRSLWNRYPFLVIPTEAERPAVSINP
jgi:hypothetical protein